MSLDEGKKRLIREFKRKSGDDRTTAYIFLTVANWDIELALSAYNHAEKCSFINGQSDLLEELKREYGSSVPDNIQEPDFTDDDSSCLDDFDDEGYPKTTTTSYIHTIYDYTFGWIIGSLYNTIYGIYNLLKNIWSSEKQNEPIVRTECTAAVYFIEKFNDTYGSTHVDFSKYTLSDTLYDGEIKNKSVLVFLNDSLDLLSTFFCNYYFSNVSNIGILNALFEIWAVDSNSRDGIDAQNRWQISPSTISILTCQHNSIYTVQLSVNEPIPLELFLRRFGINMTAMMPNNMYPMPPIQNITTQDYNYIRDPPNAITSLINQQNEEYERLMLLEKSKQDMVNFEMERSMEKFVSSIILSRELSERAEISKTEFEERSPLVLNSVEPSQIVNFRIYYPNGKLSLVRCFKTDPIKRIIDHIFISYPKILKKFKLSIPATKTEFFQYGDDENVSCENCSLDSSYRISLSYISSDDEDTNEIDMIEDTPQL